MSDKQSQLNDWFLGLPEGRRVALMQGDRWMLADAAFQAGLATQAGAVQAVERYCNKCGYFGPDELHQRPNGSGQCGYLSCLAATQPSAAPVAVVEPIGDGQGEAMLLKALPVGTLLYAAPGDGQDAATEQERLLAFCAGQLAKSDETVIALRHALLAMQHARNGNRGGLAEAIDEAESALAAPSTATAAREQEGAA